MPNLLRRLAIDKKVAAYNFLNEYTKADEKAKGTKDDAKSGIAEDYVAHEIVMEEPKINADSDSEAAGGSFAEILEEKKKALINLVDKNKLYVNYSDMDDESYAISESDKAFTKSFYAEV